MTNITQQQFQTYEPIIYGVLKSLKIHYHHAHYDDFVQNARLILCEFLQASEPEQMTKEEQHQFNGFLYQRIRWRLIDLLRRENQQQYYFDKQQPLEEIQEINYLPTNSNHHLSVKELLHNEWSQLPTYLQTYLIATIDYQLTISELARRLGVSRQTLYSWRKQLQNHLNHWQTT